MTTLKKIEGRLTEVADAASWASQLHMIIKLCTRDVCRKVATGTLPSGAIYAMWLVDEFNLYPGTSDAVFKDVITPLFRVLKTRGLDLKVINVGIKLYVVVTNDSAVFSLDTVESIIRRIIPSVPKE